jgi:hypothetical protein
MAKPREPKRKTDFETIRDDVKQEFEQEFGPTDLIDPELTHLADIEDEVRLREVDVDPASLNTIAADDTDDNLDDDDDGVIDDADEQISDLPQERTQSYGTGLKGYPTDRTGRYSRRESHLHDDPTYTLTAGDVDANYEDAEVMGEEAVGGTAPTPDQDIVDELGTAVGLEMDDRSFLRTNDILEGRDDRRWELDPKSSEDYGDRHE